MLTSSSPSGTWPHDQLPAVCQSLPGPSKLQLAAPASAAPARQATMTTARTQL
jgi:hypothetical protein